MAEVEDGDQMVVLNKSLNLEAIFLSSLSQVFIHINLTDELSRNSDNLMLLPSRKTDRLT